MDNLSSRELFLAPHRTPTKEWLKNNQSQLAAFIIVFLLWSIFDVIWSLLLYKTILWNKVIAHSFITVTLINSLYYLAKLLSFRTNFTPIKITKQTYTDKRRYK